MLLPRIERSDLPESMTWEELQRLPDELAEQIELWNGRVVWVGREPGDWRVFAGRFTNSLERCARMSMSHGSERGWRVNSETKVFLGRTGKSDFLTPDFLVHRCLESPSQDVRGSDVLLVGEVLSPAITQTDIEAKKIRYASAGIPWYWEVTLAREISAIAVVRAYGLDIGHARLPNGAQPLHSANYIVAAEWTHENSDGLEFSRPFAIVIPWTELQLDSFGETR
ncbi:Uma2 family endonuclease [Nocardia beijingensis]|uniref:Uma2 family endonuclease n=1 Tax=Nocardia beijingensis TaxID=95162 RepID=UPI001E40DC6B|nr:Uma2 family endonuclease [Nocardia beijingensis]